MSSQALPAVSAGRICLLGGTGFVGRRVAARLAGEGYALRVPTRGGGGQSPLQVLPNLQLLHVDVQDPATLEVLLEGCTAVVNLVGILNETGHDGAGFHAAHTVLTEKLVAAARAAGIRKLVQVSALGADADAGPSHYLRSKGAAERAISTQAGDLAWTILQPSVIFGPGDSFLNRFAALLRAVPLAFPLARANAQFAPVHVEDVVSAISCALADPATDGRRFQLCGTEVYTLRELVQLTAQTLQLRRWVVGLPDWLAWLQAVIMERLPGKPFSRDNFRSLSVPSLCTENGLAALGIQPRSLDANLNACLLIPRSAQALNRYRQLAGR